MGKFSFVLGAGVGYLLGTRAGHAQFEKIKKTSADVWQNPRVQSSVQKVEGKIGDVAREQGSAVTDKVAGLVKDRIGHGNGSSGADAGSSSAGSSAGGPMEPTPPQPDIEQR